MQVNNVTSRKPQVTHNIFAINIKNLENTNNINDNEIFRNTEVKATKLNERSLIFINKKLKPLRGQTKNKYQAYISKPVEIFLRKLNEKNKKLSNKNEQVQKTEDRRRVKPIQQQQLFNPNVEIRKPYTQSVYTYVYPDLPKRNKSCLHKGRMDNKCHVSETNNKTNEILIVTAPIKIFDTNTNDIYKNHNEVTSNVRSSTLTTISSSEPEQHSKNMRITSYTSRNPKSSRNNCGFLEPNWLTRMALNNKGDLNINPNDSDTEDAGIAYDDGNLDRYIKQALTDLKINDETNYNKNASDIIPTKMDNIHETR